MLRTKRVHFMNQATAGRLFIKLAVLMCGLVAPGCSAAAGSQELLLGQDTNLDLLSLRLEMGPMANYGATPWATSDIMVGTSTVKFAVDSGSNFLWVTSDRCVTSACTAHEQVSTTQPGFSWIDPVQTQRDFGPWGSMQTETGGIFSGAATSYLNVTGMPFYAAVDYDKDQFKYLTWGGGIGFPSQSSQIASGSAFYFQRLLQAKVVPVPTFSMVTYPEQKLGVVYLGGDNPAVYDANREIVLQPNIGGPVPYIWGTDLYSAHFATSSSTTTLPYLTNTRFYLDSGSSVFKGDSIYLTPILEVLYAIVDGSQNRVFEKVTDKGQWVGLRYANTEGPSVYGDLLPTFNLLMGQSCDAKGSQSAQITLSPAQYSFLVEEGESAGSWVAAFAVLDGVGGLLVGSTLMDHFYTKFTYAESGSDLTQGNMYLYPKVTTTSSEKLPVTCVDQPETSPIEGTW